MRIKYIDFENIGLYTNGRISLNSKKEKEIILLVKLLLLMQLKYVY